MFSLRRVICVDQKLLEGIMTRMCSRLSCYQGFMKSSHLKSNYMSVVSIYEVVVSGRDFGYPPILPLVIAVEGSLFGTSS